MVQQRSDDAGLFKPSIGARFFSKSRSFGFGRSAVRAGKPVEGIHVLRGIASVMVVVSHASLSVAGAEPWRRLGDSGVDIFFIISGYVMMLTTRGSIGPRAFMLKRIVRIVPLYWLATLWQARRGPFDFGLVKDLFFIPRYRIAPDWIAPVLDQGWTLNLEMMFYALFALSLTLRSRSAFLVLLALALMPLLQNLPGVYAHFYGNTLVWEFGLGIILFKYLSKFPSWPRIAYLGIIAFGLMLLASAPNTWPRGVAHGLPALLIVWASIRGCEGWLSSRALVLLGNASFAIYLFHWASFGAMKPATLVTHNPTLLMAGDIMTGIIAGIVIHLAIETPMTRVASRWIGLRKVPRPLPTG